jgi:peroxiredoxin
LCLVGTAHGAVPPEPGARAPDFTLRTLDGRAVALSALTAKSPVVLVVLRGFPGYQCPICTRQVGEFVGRAADFAAKGTKVVMVYPGPAEHVLAKAGEFLQNKSWPADWSFVLDPDYGFTNAYGLRWEAKRETAYPATFVIGRDGVVVFAKVSRTHGGRTTATEVLAQVPARPAGGGGR